MMELERVNELKKLEEREKKRIEELRKGAAIIRQQIEERREAALLEQERRDQETKQILKAIEDRAEQEKREKMNKIRAQRELMQEVSKASCTFIVVLSQVEPEIGRESQSRIHDV